jgi:hypothetical protein
MKQQEINRQVLVVLEMMQQQIIHLSSNNTHDRVVTRGINSDISKLRFMIEKQDNTEN